MLSQEQNDLITRVGPGTASGSLMRRYWQPVALVDELAGTNRPIKPVKLMGESLVLFRDDQGRYGLIERACPHRGTDLAYGRLENGGLRCAFHGWLFDIKGQCLEAPAEPDGSNLCANIKQKAYPVVEKSGILFAYMGPGEPPEFPHFDCFVAPDSHTFAFKGMIDCNWLQSLEVGIDPAHTSFLHRFFHDEDPKEGYGKLFRDTSIDSEMPMTKIMREFPRPRIEVLDRLSLGGKKSLLLIAIEGRRLLVGVGEGAAPSISAFDRVRRLSASGPRSRSSRRLHGRRMAR